MFFRRVRAVFLILVMVCLSGCNVDNGIAADTGQITISETTEVTTVAKPQTKATTEIEMVDSNDDFVYPDDPLASADSLMNLVFEAKKKIFKNEEFKLPYSWSSEEFIFGLIDIDFDDFPELIRQKSNYTINGRGNETWNIYSLQKDDFCVNLLDIIVSPYNDNPIFQQKEENENKRIIVYSYNHRPHNLGGLFITEILYDNNKYYTGNNSYKIIDRNEDGDETLSLMVMGKHYSSEEEFIIAIDKYLKDVTPANYLCEPLKYVVKNPEKKIFKKRINEDYSLLFNQYNEYLKLIK